MDSGATYDGDILTSQKNVLGLAQKQRKIAIYISETGGGSGMGDEDEYYSGCRHYYSHRNRILHTSSYSEKYQKDQRKEIMIKSNILCFQKFEDLR